MRVVCQAADCAPARMQRPGHGGPRQCPGPHAVGGSSSKLWSLSEVAATRKAFTARGGPLCGAQGRHVSWSAAVARLAAARGPRAPHSYGCARSHAMTPTHWSDTQRCGIATLTGRLTDNDLPTPVGGPRAVATSQWQAAPQDRCTTIMIRQRRRGAQAHRRARSGPRQASAVINCARRAQPRTFDR